jgi:hypothetical protein
MEKIGFTVQRLRRGGIVKHSGVTVRLAVGEDGSRTDFAGLWNAGVFQAAFDKSDLPTW